jgi:glutamate/tyrosine decarboxylase-like PLP-dependent enzyme
MLDDAIEYMRTVRDRPAWQPVPQAAKDALAESIPRDGQPLDAVYAAFKEHILPYPTGNIHPRFWGMVKGTGTPVSMLADMLAAAMNSNVSGFDQSATYVELETIGWLTELFGLPPEASGLFVSGGTPANVLGLLVARNARAPFDARKEGLFDHPRLRVYASTQTHAWLKRACNIIGIGESALCEIPADSRHRILIPELRSSISRDRSGGLVPFCVVGNAGTVNAGATDDLRALAEICRSENLWFHVDGAFGALTVLTRKYKNVADGMQFADSIAFDLHKWGYLSYDIGCVLVRDGAEHRAAMANPAPYASNAFNVSGFASTYPLLFADLGVQLSRSFRALKVWMAFKTYGTSRLGEAIERNIDQAQYLASIVRQSDDFELLAPAELNVVCFRHKTPGDDDRACNLHNAELLAKLQQSGVALPTSTILDGRFAIRVAITNHRTSAEDIDILLAALRRCAAGLEEQVRQ